MEIPIKYTMQEIMREYNLQSITSGGYIYVEILKEAGIIAYTFLVQKLAPHGYYPCKHTPGM